MKWPRLSNSVNLIVILRFILPAPRSSLAPSGETLARLYVISIVRLLNILRAPLAISFISDRFYEGQ